MEVVTRNKCKEGGSKMMKTVIRLKGDAVMVFDDRGEQITEGLSYWTASRPPVSTGGH